MEIGEIGDVGEVGETGEMGEVGEGEREGGFAIVHRISISREYFSRKTRYCGPGLESRISGTPSVEGGNLHRG